MQFDGKHILVLIFTLFAALVGMMSVLVLMPDELEISGDMRCPSPHCTVLERGLAGD